MIEYGEYSETNLDLKEIILIVGSYSKLINKSNSLYN